MDYIESPAQGPADEGEGCLGRDECHRVWGCHHVSCDVYVVCVACDVFASFAECSVVLFVWCAMFPFVYFWVSCDDFCCICRCAEFYHV